MAVKSYLLTLSNSSFIVIVKKQMNKLPTYT